jgi:hypothetical protein
METLSNRPEAMERHGNQAVATMTFEEFVIDMAHWNRQPPKSEASAVPAKSKRKRKPHANGSAK